MYIHTLRTSNEAQCPETDIDVRDTAGMTPLLWGCYYDQLRVVGALLQAGANSQVCCVCVSGCLCGTTVPVYVYACVWGVCV